MTVFQIVSISLLVLLLVRELLSIRRGTALQGGKWFRALVWTTATVAIARPDWVQGVADRAGIDRGADFVFYLFVLLFLGAAFHFYSRLIQMQRQITQLVRHVSIQEAQCGADLADD